MQLNQAPVQLVLAFGADAGSSYINTIPVPSQISTHPGAASYTDGFPPLTMTDVTAGGVPIAGPDMNGILNEMSAVDVWMCAGGGFPYNATFSAAIGGYPKGARVLMASGNGYWVSTVDNNTSDPDTGGAGWASANENAITALTGDVTAAGPGSAAATLAASGVTAGSYTNANITVDSKGRVTSASAGTPPFTGTSGHQILPSGLILQWGTTGSLVNDTPTIISFPVAFPNACFSVTGSDTFAASLSATWSFYAWNASGFTARCDGNTATGQWFAIGY